MITKPTVFVLGAGASKPYGFPTGFELRSKICDGLKRGRSLRALVDSTEPSIDVDLMRLEFEQSGLNSIDSFIAFRPEFQEVCNIAIAAVLLPLERESSLTNVCRNPSDSDDHTPGDGGWYQALWNILLSNLRCIDDLKQNKLSIITFNYDRSLETFLVNAIRFTFGVPIAEAVAALQALPIAHVYGDLGECNPETGIDYGLDNEHESGKAKRVLAASNRIRTVPNVRGDRDTQCADWLAEAKQVLFFGFGFDPMNCLRIGIANTCKMARDAGETCQVLANDFSRHRNSQLVAEQNFGLAGPAVTWVAGDCNGLIKDARMLLM